jgi:RNA polymerase sigma-70 factor, ECF subfamily
VHGTEEKGSSLDTLSERDIANWYPRLYRTALRLTGSEHDAADLTQQAFCKALNNWHRFEVRSSRLTWLHAILVNAARDHFRSRKVRQTESLDEWALPDTDGPLTGAELVERGEELGELRKAIETLSPTVRGTFVATVLDGYSYEQASEMLGVPVGTVSSRVHQARQELRVSMKGFVGGSNHE